MRWWQAVLMVVAGAVCVHHIGDAEGGKAAMTKIRLPEPRLKGQMSVEEAIQRRRSRRNFSDAALSIEQLGQVLWCGQGITGRQGGKRAAPSAGATYPMEVFVVVGAETVGGLEAGAYRYIAAEHALEKVLDGDVRGPLAAAALGQSFLADAPADILMAADYARTTGRYGQRGRRYVDMEAGHIGQNIYLQAEALGLGTVAVGAFRDDEVARVLQLHPDLTPIYMMPIGYTK